MEIETGQRLVEQSTAVRPPDADALGTKLRPEAKMTRIRVIFASQRPSAELPSCVSGELGAEERAGFLGARPTRVSTESARDLGRHRGCERHALARTQPPLSGAAVGPLNPCMRPGELPASLTRGERWRGSLTRSPPRLSR